MKRMYEYTNVFSLFWGNTVTISKQKILCKTFRIERDWRKIPQGALIHTPHLSSNVYDFNLYHNFLSSFIRCQIYVTNENIHIFTNEIKSTFMSLYKAFTITISSVTVIETIGLRTSLLCNSSIRRPQVFNTYRTRVIGAASAPCPVTLCTSSNNTLLTNLAFVLLLLVCYLSELSVVLLDCYYIKTRRTLL